MIFPPTLALESIPTGGYKLDPGIGYQVGHKFPHTISQLTL